MLTPTYEIPLSAEKLWWRYGRPAELWLSSSRQIGRFIEQHRIEPVDPIRLAADDPVPIAPLRLKIQSEQLAAELVRPLPFPGGKRVPHLHYDGEFYALSDEQWEEFSRSMVERFQAKLDKAGAVPFVKLLELGDAIETM